MIDHRARLLTDAAKMREWAHQDIRDAKYLRDELGLPSDMDVVRQLAWDGVKKMRLARLLEASAA